MTRLEISLDRSLDELAVDDAPMIVGVSGGADSMALLDALSRWNQRQDNAGPIVVAHLNHLLRGEESAADEEFVRLAAARYDLPFELDRCDVAGLAKARQANLEAVARECRYDFLHRVARSFLANPKDRSGVLVLTAHHADDQAETFLMRLLRGSGTTGLTGIHPQRRLSHSVRLIRPLLHVDRATVLEHCRHYGVDFRIDQSNYEVDYLRNRIRHELLVDLRRYNGSVSEILVRTADLLRDDEECLHDLAREHRQRVMTGGGLAIDLLQRLPVALRRRVVRDWIAERRGDLNRITSTHLAAIEGLLARGQSGRRIELPGGLVVQRVFATLHFVESTPEPLAPRDIIPGERVDFGAFWVRIDPGGATRRLPTPGDWREARWHVRVQMEIPPRPWRIRGRLAGDILRPPEGRHRIKLKKLMIRHKIPVSKRDTWPVIVDRDDQLVWVPGLALNADVVGTAAREVLREDLRGVACEGESSPGFWLLVGEN